MTHLREDPSLEEMRGQSSNDNDDLRDAWEGLRMVREAVETYMPAGSLPSREFTGVKPSEEAMALVEAIVKTASDQRRQSFAAARERIAQALDRRQPLAAHIVRRLPDK